MTKQQLLEEMGATHPMAPEGLVLQYLLNALDDLQSQTGWYEKSEDLADTNTTPSPVPTDWIEWSRVYYEDTNGDLTKIPYRSRVGASQDYDSRGLCWMVDDLGTFYAGKWENRKINAYGAGGTYKLIYKATPPGLTTADAMTKDICLLPRQYHQVPVWRIHENLYNLFPLPGQDGRYAFTRWKEGVQEVKKWVNRRGVDDWVPLGIERY